MIQILAVLTGALFGLGVYHLLQRDTIKSVLGLSLILGAGNLFLLCCTTFRGGHAPYVPYGADTVDPLPQALVLTAIVIGFGVQALVAALVLSIAFRLGTLDGDRVSHLKE